MKRFYKTLLPCLLALLLGAMTLAACTAEKDPSETSPETGSVTLSEESASESLPLQDPADTAFDGVTEIYVSGDSVATGITMGDYALTACTLNGADILADVSAEKGARLTLGQSVVDTMKYGVNRLAVADARGNSYEILLYVGVAEDEIAYYDFDLNTYSNSGNLTVPYTIEENGINGSSLRLTKASDGDSLFGFYKNKNAGFPAFTFVPDTEYKLSFDMKVLEGTAAEWWCPIRFGSNGDVVYLYPDGSWMTPDYNSLCSQATVMQNEDGSYRVTVIFKATAQTKNLEFPNWGGAVDVLLDNVCLEKLNPDLIRIGCVGDSITEATNTDISYPETLQMLLGYDEYYVFNFGKSGANVLAEGLLPYRQHGEWQYNTLKTWNPDVIFMMLGTNDGRPDSGIALYQDKAFIDEYIGFVNEFNGLGAQVYTLISPYAFGNEYGIQASLVNDRIVNVQGYIADLEGLPVIDVHAAVKGLDRETYFPDYIHGNNAGYAKIAEAVYDGYVNGHTAGKYALGYALKTASDKTSQAYMDAKAVYDDANATQEAIDSAYKAIKDTIVVPSNEDSSMTGSANLYAPLDTAVSLPVRLHSNTVESLTVGETALTAEDYTVTDNEILIRAGAVAEKGFYPVSLQTSDGDTFDFVLHYGYNKGDISYIDSDIITYANTNDVVINPTVEAGVAGFEGNCLHFYDTGKTWFGYDAEGAFGLVNFSFVTGETYTFSFDYKIGPDWNKTGGDAATFMPMWFGWDNGDAIYWYNDLHTLHGNLATDSAITCIDEENRIYSFSVTFTAPQNCARFELAGWLDFYDIYMDNIRLEKVS